MADILPPSPTDAPFGSYNWQDWYIKVRNAINAAASISWSQITDFTGSNLTQLVTRSHQSLQNVLGTTVPNTAFGHVPIAGGTNQVLSKASPTDYDYVWTTPAAPGTGTVTSVSVTTANGVSGTVATATTTPAISLTLGAITPTSVGASGAVTAGIATPLVTAAGRGNMTTNGTASAINVFGVGGTAVGYMFHDGTNLQVTNTTATGPVFIFTNNTLALTIGVGGALTLIRTVTATVGAITLNVPSGRAIIAAGATSVVVTNSLVSATSMVLATLATNDATAIIKNVVPGAGSFTVNLTAAATGNTNINFLVTN